MKLHKHWGYNKNTIDVQTQRVQISMVFSIGGPADSLIELARLNLRKVRGFQLAVYA